MFINIIQILRAIAANGVLLSHLVIIEGKYGQGIQLLPNSFIHGSYGVDLFFVISGFIMTMIGQKKTWHDFIFSRITRIYPTYWFYTSIVLIVFLINPSIVNSAYQGQQPSLWRSYLLIPDTITPLLAVGWTLIHEMYFYIVFTAILAFNIKLKNALIVWGTVIIAMTIFNISQYSPISTLIFSPLTIEFILGAFVGLAVKNNKYSKVFLIPILSCGVIALVAGFMYCDSSMTLSRVLMIGLPCALVIYGCVIWEFTNEPVQNNWLTRLGDASYSTYLSHYLVLPAIGRVFNMIPIHNLFAELVFIVVCITCSNIIGLLSHRFIERPSTDLIANFKNKYSTFKFKMS